jgi:Kef-type K+ transport system membrane component KefB
VSTHEAFMLLLLSAGAFAVPLLSERIGWFIAPCEILYGTLLASFVPGAAQPGDFISNLSHFGFLLLLFLAGMEIDFTLLRQRGLAMVLRAGVVAVGVQAIGLAMTLLFGLPAITALLFGAVSISVVLAILKERGLSQKPFGQTILIVGAIGEFLTILEVTSYDLVTRYGVSGPLALAVLKLLLLLALGYVALRGLSAAVTQQPGRFLRIFAHDDPAELGVRGALAFMLCFAAVAVFLRVEQILATFVAGAVCSFAFAGRRSLAEKLMTIGQGFFIPVFFITVGLGLRLADLLSGRLLALLFGLLLAMAALRFFAVPLFRIVGLGWSEALPAALLLAAPLTLQVAIVQVGIDLGQLDGGTKEAVLGMSIASAVIFPLVARSLMPREARRSVPSRPNRWGALQGYEMAGASPSTSRPIAPSSPLGKLRQRWMELSSPRLRAAVSRRTPVPSEPGTTTPRP